MENKTYTFWIARDKNDSLFAYEDKPERCDNQKEWFSGKFLSQIEKSFFPELTWEDEPIEVMLTPVIKS